MCTSKIPEKASLSWVSKSGHVKKLLSVFQLCRVYNLFLVKTTMLSLSFSLLSSSGSLQSSCNTPHITLSEFSLEAILRSPGFKKKLWYVDRHINMYYCMNGVFPRIARREIAIIDLLYEFRVTIGTGNNAAGNTVKFCPLTDQ